VKGGRCEGRKRKGKVILVRWKIRESDQKRKRSGREEECVRGRGGGRESEGAR
jgi:hypothetical protein